MTGDYLYHGSLQIVKHPLVHVGRRDLDFGQGFYTTDIKQQAENWAKTLQSRRRFYTDAYVNIYHFDRQGFELSSYHKLLLDEYDISWLDFISSSRKGKKPWMGYDLIEGGVANDSVIDTVEAYMSGIMDAKTALGRLVFHKPNNQICILNQEIVDKFLTFDKAIKIN